MSSENEILQTNIRDYFILLIAEYNNCDLYNGYDKRYRLLERMMSVETRLKTTIGSDVSPITCANKIDNTLKNIKTLEKKIIEHAKLKYKDTTEERIELYNRIVEIYNNSGGVLHVVYILYYTTDTVGSYLSYTIQYGSILESVKKIADLEDSTHIHYTLKVFEDYMEIIPVDKLETEILQYIKKDAGVCSEILRRTLVHALENIPVDNLETEITQYIKKDVGVCSETIPIYTKVPNKDMDCSIYYDNVKCKLLYVFDTINTPQLYYTFNNEKRKYIIIALKHARRRWK
jgi:hypothetical protein